jgi:predicted DNA-binding protein (UPF0251 family)
MRVPMGRQERTRSVQYPPRFFSFSADDAPAKRPGGTLADTAPEAIEMRLDEYEAVRLSDHLGYDHIQASRIMGVSRPTFTRLIKRARAKLADFLTSGSRLEIRGGQVLFASNVYCCSRCHRPFPWDGEGAPRCGRCGGEEVIKAQASCHHDCRCCEQAAGCIDPD